jgi:hypothetical protein
MRKNLLVFGAVVYKVRSQFEIFVTAKERKERKGAANEY